MRSGHASDGWHQYLGFIARNGLFLRVFFATAASVLAAVALSAGLFWFAIDTAWDDLYDRDLGDLQQRVERAVVTGSLRSLQLQTERRDGVVVVVLRNDRPIGRRPPRWLMERFELTRRQQPEALEQRIGRYVYGEFQYRSDRYKIILLPNVRSLWQLAQPLGIAFAILTLVVASAWVAWMLTRPLRVLSHSTRRLAEGDLQARVPRYIADREDAVGRLGAEFNHMAERVDSLLGSQQQLLRDVSHELRTPLARLQVALTLAQDEPDKAPAMLSRIEIELGRLDDLIGQVLSLSRLQSGTDNLERTPIELRSLLAEVVENAEFEFAEKDVSIQIKGPIVELLGDPGKLASAFENIVRNAMRYAAEGSTVELSIGVHQQTALVEVADRGPGVDEAELPRLFEAFYRVDDARDTRTGGHGVGLAIAEQAIARNGGTLRARNRDGGGLVVSACLPLKP